ncbi:HAMP domain-containing histidine kinase [Sporolactobacillus sp. CPB3-1]|uniref:histidine kinase n=1 Tax=Sporolactobacillus mangiferae TaxID=2940498 RepID=A0ABT0MBT6_9BACL|nr:HAMP domain-containing sensor histidine kinase [Sporolactobacillus mangiferae]MCL1632332.1 HAMP domain-containing histidine kinase [Sporolactobacillus mangiferae]
MTLFRKTLIKLTITNAVLLILLLSLLGGAIYFYEQNVTFRDSNKTLKDAASGRLLLLRRNPIQGQDQGAMDQHLRNPGFYWVITSSSNEQLQSSMDGFLGTDGAKQFFKPFLNTTGNGVSEKKAHGRYYHLLVKKEKINGQSLKIIFSIDVTPEKNLLNTLRMIILIGLATGAAVSVVAGYILARRALRPIESAWGRQNRFVADASHELRTPLSIIQLKIEGLLRQPRQQVQDVGEDIAIMLDETRRLSKLVANLLTLARSDANRLEVNPAPLDLSAMLKKVTEPFAEMAEFEEKTFTLAGTEEPIYINGDEQRIHQLVVILLDNAMKFTPKGGKISVACVRENRYARLSVSDNGCGISEDDLKHIFDRFYQADDARTGQKGTGLGLSIAEWIVHKHRGKIEVSSQLGEGTTFFVRLPLMKDEPVDQDHHDHREGENEDDRNV